MSLGPIRLSFETGKATQQPSVADAINVRFPTLSGAGLSGGADYGAAMRHVGDALDRLHDRQVRDDADDAAQKTQSALSEETINLYDKRESGAAGVVNEFDSIVGKRIKDVGATFDPDTRKMFEQRMAPWIAGRRENLLQHQHREVRRGLVNNLENDMMNRALTETDDIIANLNAQEEYWRIVAEPDDKKEKEAFYETRLEQAMAVNTYFDGRYAYATSEGLYGEEEAKSRCLKHRHDATKTLLDASLNGGYADFADFALNRLAPADGKNGLAAACGLSADELSDYRSRLAGLRERQKSEIEADRRKTREAAVEADRAVYCQELVSGLDPAYVPLSRRERLRSVLDNPDLSPSDKESRLKDWNAWYDRREADAAEKEAYERRLEAAKAKAKEDANRTAEEETGYVTIEQVNGKKQTVWISPTGWGKTGSSGYELVCAESVARDPQKALVNAEAMRATGNISKEDYISTVALASALQNKQIVEAAKAALGGDFLKLLDAGSQSGKGNAILPGGGRMPGIAEGSDFERHLWYRHGSEERLFSAQEKVDLLREIGWMKAHGYEQKDINKCVETICYPKMQKWYDMTLNERLASKEFMDSIRTYGSFDESVAAAVGTINSERTGKAVPIEKVR